MIDGTWRPVAAQLGGRDLPGSLLETMSLTMADGTYTVMVGEEVDRGLIELDSATEPKSIDVTGTEGPNQGRTFPAIYELAGDTLRVCYDLAGQARPTSFESPEHTRLFLVRYERER